MIIVKQALSAFFVLTLVLASGMPAAGRVGLDSIYGGIATCTLGHLNTNVLSGGIAERGIEYDPGPGPAQVFWPVGLTSTRQFSRRAAIYVDAAAAPGGDGTSWPTAYQTIAQAVTEANIAGNSTIYVEEGVYDDHGLVIVASNVKIIGRTELLLDARGLPTGAVTNATRWMSGITGTLLTVRASHFEVAGMVFDGGTPSPFALTPPLLVIDGGALVTSPGPSLDGIWIHENCFQDAGRGVALRLASATIEGNFIGRNAGGLQATAGFKPPSPNAWPEQQVTFGGNRVMDNVNLGANFGGDVGSNASGLPTFTAGAGVNHVVVSNNDFTGNGDARNPIPGSNPPVYYPQPIQYTALLFNVMHGTNSDPNQGAEIHASITDNTFIRNGYGVAYSPRLPLNANIVGYAVEATLSGNTYCANGLNSIFVDFSLISQSHGITGTGQQFRYVIDTVYTIDATGDGLTLSDLDYDHPATDPRLPLSAPGTLVLNNTFIFNGQTIPPGINITVPPLAMIETVDRTPPTILSSDAVPVVLWPPNGQMIPVSIAIDAKDGCDQNPASEIIHVTHDQLNLPGSQVPYFEVTGPLSLNLRAARSGSEGTRTYSITVRCTDGAGNSTLRDVAVTAPLHP